MKLLIAGEGTDELARWFHRAQYQKPSDGPGIIEALLHRLRPDGWEIAEGRPWSKIPKYVAQRGSEERALGPEAKTILGLALIADEKGYTLVFVRDRDGDAERAKDFDDGLKKAREKWPSLPIAGGMAKEEIESWLLSLLGEKRAEEHAKAKELLRERRGIKTLEDKVQVVERADLEHVREDAQSLRAWLDQVRSVIAAPTAEP